VSANRKARESREDRQGLKLLEKGLLAFDAETAPLAPRGIFFKTDLRYRLAAHHAVFAFSSIDRATLQAKPHTRIELRAHADQQEASATTYHQPAQTLRWTIRAASFCNNSPG